MPRSYSFDHFQVPVAEPRSRSLRRQDKQHLAESQHGSLEAQGQGIHYGKSHAQTEEILKARALAPPRRDASKARVDSSTPRPERPPAAPRISRNTSPIGALPATEELPPRGRFQDLLDEASRHLDALQSGLSGVGKTVVRLASLPLEAVRLAARRLRFVHH